MRSSWLILRIKSKYNFQCLSAKIEKINEITAKSLKYSVHGSSSLNRKCRAQRMTTWMET